MWGLEFACATAKSYGSGWDSRRRNFAKRNGEPAYKVGQPVEIEIADERHQGPVRRIKIDWELESWVYDIDIADLEPPFAEEVPECVVYAIDAIERLAKIVKS